MFRLVWLGLVGSLVLSCVFVLLGWDDQDSRAKAEIILGLFAGHMPKGLLNQRCEIAMAAIFSILTTLGPYLPRWPRKYHVC